MICHNENITLVQRSDFECIAQLAQHCDTKKLCIAIEEAQQFDLAEQLCDFWEDIVGNKENPDYQLLLCGGTYTGCGDKTKRFLGLKRVIVYYAYARYLLINEFNDTPVGNVTKTNDFSLPKSIKEINLYADKYRTMAHETLKNVEEYLCHHKELFTQYNSNHCAPCNCTDHCDGKSKAQGYGLRTKVITKKI